MEVVILFLFKIVKIIDKDRFNYRLPSKDREKYFDLYVNENFYYPIKNGEKVSVALDIPQCLSLSVKKDEKVGKIEIYVSKQLIFCQNSYKL